MALKTSTMKISNFLNNFRKFSSSSAPLTNITINNKTGVSTLTLQKPPVNSLNLELLTEIHGNLVQLEKERSRGLILTSSSKSVFSAGLDIMEIYKPDETRIKQFWTKLQDVWIALYGSSYPTVAVINGHSPAGGCLLAISCEYRIMSNNFTIGLNETQLGIVAPQWFITPFQTVLGKRQAELALTSGWLFKTQEALKVGLVDEVVDSKEEGLERAEKFLTRFAKISPKARSITKNVLRGPVIQYLVENKQKDLDYFLNFTSSETVQKSLGIYLEGLKQKRQ